MARKPVKKLKKSRKKLLTSRVKKMAFIESGQTFDKENHRKKMKRLMENMDKKKFTFRILPKNLKKLKIILAEEGQSIDSFLNDMILKYIEK
jgi:DNA-directed RNA polymerase subunit F